MLLLSSVRVIICLESGFSLDQFKVGQKFILPKTKLDRRSVNYNNSKVWFYKFKRLSVQKYSYLLVH